MAMQEHNALGTKAAVLQVIHRMISSPDNMHTLSMDILMIDN